MNWFARYAIPGSYFLALTIAWISSIYRCVPVLALTSYEKLLTVGAATFLPLGYILHTLQQCIYLLFKPLGILRAAKAKTAYQFDFPAEDEVSIEAHSLLLIWKHKASLEEFSYISEWIRKRMDVMAVNFSLFIATIVSFFAAWLIPHSYSGWKANWNSSRAVTLLLISIIVLVIASISWGVMHKQIRIAMEKLYGRHA